MSQKITSKNLSYDSSLPPFLAALRAQAAGLSSPTPQRRGNAKRRSTSEDLEDAPLVVDEHGNTIDLDAERDKEEAQAALREGAAKDEGAGAGADAGADSTVPAAETKSAVGVGGGKKRKAGRVVGGDEGMEDSTKERQEKGRGRGAVQGEGAAAASDKKAKKKAKKIKLSFDEAEG